MQILGPGTNPVLLFRLDGLSPDSRPRWGRMNAHRMVCHLNDSFALAMSERNASENITFISRNLIRFLALRTPVPWPKGVPTRPELDSEAGGTPPSDFASDKAALAAALQRFPGHPRDFRFARHPMFGELTEWEWLRWGYLHTDHHLRQFGL